MDILERVGLHLVGDENLFLILDLNQWGCHSKLLLQTNSLSRVLG
jgi:hypothetical protein